MCVKLTLLISKKHLTNYDLVPYLMYTAHTCRPSKRACWLWHYIHYLSIPLYTSADANAFRMRESRQQYSLFEGRLGRLRVKKLPRRWQKVIKNHKWKRIYEVMEVGRGGGVGVIFCFLLRRRQKSLISISTFSDMLIFVWNVETINHIWTW